MPPGLPGKQVQLPPVSVPRFVSTVIKRTFGIKSMYPPRPDRFNIGPNLPILTSRPSVAHERKAFTLPLRTGVLAIKKGMTAIFDPQTGERTACTVLQLDRVQVISHKTREK